MAASEPCAPEWDRRKSIKLGFCSLFGKVIENGFRSISHFAGKQKERRDHLGRAWTFSLDKCL